MRNLDGATAVITGGASGIGLAMARRFRRAGMRVAIADIEAAALAAALSDLRDEDGPEVVGVTCDVTSPDSMAELRGAVIGSFGAVHVVCLNAGVVARGPVLETALSTWQWLMGVNVYGVVNGLHAFGPGLVEQGEGHIVTTASAGGLSSPPTLGAYNATKHAVVGLSGTLRAELAPSGVGVSVLCPGAVRTNIFTSERNRPEALAGPTHLVPGPAEMPAHAAAPEVVADAVHDAVLENRFLVLPNPEIFGMIQGRLDEVAEAMAARSS